MRLVLLLLMLGVLSACLAGQKVDPATLPDQQQIRLYPGDPPGEPTWDKPEPIPEMQVNARGSYRFVHEPVLDVYHAKGAGRTGAAVVICPGGGYGALAYDHEGIQIANWLNDHGITGVILRYRMFPYRHPVPMMDVQRAIQTVRANADAWALDDERIGVMGFSAGGHLASTAATHFIDGKPGCADPIQSVSSRPDFAVLVYPVLSMRAQWTHEGSRRNLLGPSPDEQLMTLMSSEEQVDATTPPTLLVHSEDDKVVLIRNSEAFLEAMKSHDVPGKLLVYQTGGHGYGLGRSPQHETAAWPDACLRWLNEIGIIGTIERE